MAQVEKGHETVTLKLAGHCLLVFPCLLCLSLWSALLCLSICPFSFSVSVFSCLWALGAQTCLHCIDVLSVSIVIVKLHPPCPSQGSGHNYPLWERIFARLPVSFFPLSPLTFNMGSILLQRYTNHSPPPKVLRWEREWLHHPVQEARGKVMFCLSLKQSCQNFHNQLDLHLNILKLLQVLMSKLFW